MTEELLNLLSPAKLTLRTTTNQTLFHEGQYITFEVTSDRTGYLYLLVFSEGNVATCIFPSPDDRRNQITSGTHTIPRDNTYEFPVQEPFGQDLIVAILSPQQLDLGDRITFTWQEIFDRLQLTRVKEVWRSRGIGVQAKPTVAPELEWQTATLTVTTRR